MRNHKKGCPVITLDDERVAGVIEKAAAAADSPLIIAKKVHSRGFSDMSELFDYGDIPGIKCGLPGVHQLENASLAIECALQMGIDEKFIAGGIENASNPGDWNGFPKIRQLFLTERITAAVSTR